MSILEGELAETITAALLDASVPYDVLISRTVQGPPDPDRPWEPGQPVTTTITAKGFAESYSEMFIAQAIVQASDVKVVVLVPTMGDFFPAPGDDVTVRGRTLRVLNVKPDPALATVELQARA